MRQFTIGLLNKTDGSAKFVNGDTVVIASVVGPKETTNDVASTQVSVKWSSEGDVRDETDAERNLRRNPGLDPGLEVMVDIVPCVLV